MSCVNLKRKVGTRPQGLTTGVNKLPHGLNIKHKNFAFSMREQHKGWEEVLVPEQAPSWPEFEYPLSINARAAQGLGGGAGAGRAGRARARGRASGGHLGARAVRAGAPPPPSLLFSFAGIPQLKSPARWPSRSWSRSLRYAPPSLTLFSFASIPQLKSPAREGERLVAISELEPFAQVQAATFSLHSL